MFMRITLIDQLNSQSIFSKQECSMLNLIRERRNKAAHPSGHTPSAEEARFIFFVVIKHFLSKHTLVTTQLADEILYRLENNIFFPTNNSDEGNMIVRKEIENLHPSTYPYLLIKLTEVIKISSGDKKRNADYLLNGLASQDNPELISAKKYVIQAKADDIHYMNNFMSCLYNNPNLIEDLDEITLSRLKNMLSISIERAKSVSVTNITHPSMVFNKIIKKVRSRDVKKYFKELTKYIKEYPFHTWAISSLLTDEEVYKMYLKVLVENAASSSFNIANSFIENSQEIEKHLYHYLKPKEALEILLGVLRSAQRGAWSAQSLRDEKFKSIKNIRELAREYVEQNFCEANSVFSEEISFLRMPLEQIRDSYLFESSL